jgi:enoyl-CoA hydratase
MSDSYELKFEAMDNRLVNYGTTNNGIAVIELTSDSAGAPLTGENDRSPNTYTHEMMRDIDQAVVKARFDDDVTVIVLTGNGASFFSAGASIQMLNSVTPGFKYNFCLHANETLSRLELNLGVLAGTGGTARLTRLIGKAKALELMVTGNLISFEDAQNLTLLNDIYEGSPEGFREDILDYCSQFTLPNKAVKAVGNIKRSCQTGPEIPFEYHLALERELQASLFNSSDAKEGIAAYVEKRQPHFTGQ